MVETFFGYFLGKIIDLIPGFLLRIVLSPEKVARKLTIDLWRNFPMRVSLAGSVPSIEIWFTTTNFNYIDVSLDRLLVELWLTQPLTDVVLLARQDIPRLSSVSEIRLSSHQLSRAQRQWIETRTAAGRTTEPFTLHIDAYFQSRVGWIHIKHSLQQQSVEVR